MRLVARCWNARSLIIALLMWFGGAGVMLAHADLPESDADVRLIVDISGSMKQTDPQNLRVPALKLLVNLLPDGANAGIWSFGQQVNMLVPFAPVDSNWRESALANADKINSVGLYTNIGAALEKATELSPRASNANIVLLTDGKVDIDKNARRNERERQRILSEVLPALQQKGFRLHTIALSGDADTELLQQLSQSSDGVSTLAESADELMSTFLQLFDQSVPATRLPLTDNRFLVDASVNEFTALIFRGADAAPTQLIKPDGSPESATRHSPNVKWYGADSYDLITVREPAAGQWQVQADERPDNRVTVVSDLELRVEPISNNLVAGSALPLTFALYEKGAPIADPDFLSLLTARAEISRLDKPGQWKVSLLDGRLPVDGVFRESIPRFETRGDYQLTLTVDGKTFAREYRHRVKVGSLFTVNKQKRVEDDHVAYDFTVEGDRDLLNTEQSAVVAHVKQSDGTSSLTSLQQTEIGHWEFTLVPEVQGRYVIELQASGEDSDGQQFDEVLPNQYVVFPEEGDPVVTAADREVEALQQMLEEEKAALARETAAPDPQEPEIPASSEPAAAVASSEAAAVDNEPEPEAEESIPEEEDSAPINWGLIAAIVAGNLMLVGAIYFVYRRLSTKGVQSELDEFEQMLQGENKTAATEPANTAKPSNNASSDSDDPLAALDALSDSAGAESDMFPLQENSEQADLPMDDLGDSDDAKS